MKRLLKLFLYASILLVFIAFNSGIKAQKSPETFKNPILSGYHPDPSICRVGDDYYLVNSTFTWFPGIPIYHSKDLVNWELIGHGIHRPDQLNFDGLTDKFGVFAVTIRHHEGVFYLITTCVLCGDNFYLTAKNPAGPWSDPVWLKDAPGIDPSLMWDDDGKCYYTGQMGITDHTTFPNCAVWTQELDLAKQKLFGERKVLTSGHANNAQWSEGPHLYKIKDNYLLMLSEGGTGLYHAITVHHSDSVLGTYDTDQINPVISHRQFGQKYPLQAIGHGDLVQTQNGEWWCVMLGKRVYDGETTLARETFLAKVVFEGQTPIFNPGKGRVLFEQKRPDLPWTPFPEIPAKDEFENKEIDLKWCTIRTPKERFYEVKDGNLVLNLRLEECDSLVNSSILIQRIEHHKFSASTKVNFKTKKDNEQAGLIIYRTSQNHYKLLKEKESVVLYKSFKGKSEEIARIPYFNDEVFFAVEGNFLDAQFSFGASYDKMKNIGNTQTLKVIADGNGNQFNGAGVGVYASSRGKETKAKAFFDWFEYLGK